MIFALLGLGLLLALAGAAGGGGAATSLAERVAQALASRDPGIMRGLADELEASGGAKELEIARELRAEADSIDPSGKVPAKQTKEAKRRDATGGGGSGGGGGKAGGGGTPALEDPRRKAAQALTESLKATGGLRGKYREDRGAVRAWQLSEGLASDGFYGVASAARILSYGLIPVAPMYWSGNAKKAAESLNAFTAAVRTVASGDKERASEYADLLRDTVASFRGLTSSSSSATQASAKHQGKGGYLDMMRQATVLENNGYKAAADVLRSEANRLYPATTRAA